MERARSTIALRPATTRPVFWVFLILSILLKTSISSAAAPSTTCVDGTETVLSASLGVSS